MIANRMTSPTLTLAAAVAAALTTSLASAATTYVYTPTTASTTWSSGTNWSPSAPAGAVDTHLTYVDATGATVLGPVTNTNTNDNAGLFQLNILDLGGRGSATTGEAASITIASASLSTGLQFVSNGSTLPVVNLFGINGTGTSTLSYTVSSPVTLTNDTTFTGGAGSATTGTGIFNFSGSISGAGNINKAGGNSAAAVNTLILSGDNTNWTGNLVFVGTGSARVGNVRLASNTALGADAAVKTITSAAATGGTSSSAGNTLELANNITINNKNYDLTGRGSLREQNAQMRNFSGNNTWNGNVSMAATGGSYGVSSFTAGNSLTINGTVSNTVAAAGGRLLTLFGAGDFVFGGPINDGAFTGASTGFSKVSTGAMTINSTGNTMSFASNVNAGTLYLNGSVASTAALQVGVLAGTGGTITNSAGTLAGNGSGFGAVTVAGVLAPGSVASPVGSIELGSLAIGSAVLTGTPTNYQGALNIELSNSVFSLNSTEGYDRVKTTGATTLGAGLAALNLSLVGTPTFVVGDTFGIIDAGAGVTGTFNGLAEGASIVVGNYTFAITYLGNVTDTTVAATGGNDVVLSVTNVAVPEPATLALVGLGGLLLVRRRRN